MLLWSPTGLCLHDSNNDMPRLLQPVTLYIVSAAVSDWLRIADMDCHHCCHVNRFRMGRYGSIIAEVARIHQVSIVFLVLLHVFCSQMFDVVFYVYIFLQHMSNPFYDWEWEKVYLSTHARDLVCYN